MMDEMFSALEGGREISSSIRTSVRTHMMAFAAEKSRLKGGKVILLDDIYGKEIEMNAFPHSVNL